MVKMLSDSTLERPVNAEAGRQEQWLKRGPWEKVLRQAGRRVELGSTSPDGGTFSFPVTSVLVYVHVRLPFK